MVSQGPLEKFRDGFPPGVCCWVSGFPTGCTGPKEGPWLCAKAAESGQRRGGLANLKSEAVQKRFPSKGMSDIQMVVAPVERHSHEQGVSRVISMQSGRPVRSTMCAAVSRQPKMMRTRDHLRHRCCDRYFPRGEFRRDCAAGTSSSPLPPVSAGISAGISGAK